MRMCPTRTNHHIHRCCCCEGDVPLHHQTRSRDRNLRPYFFLLKTSIPWMFHFLAFPLVSLSCWPHPQTLLLQTVVDGVVEDVVDAYAYVDVHVYVYVYVFVYVSVYVDVGVGVGAVGQDERYAWLYPAGATASARLGGRGCCWQTNPPEKLLRQSDRQDTRDHHFLPSNGHSPVQRWGFQTWYVSSRPRPALFLRLEESHPRWTVTAVHRCSSNRHCCVCSWSRAPRYRICAYSGDIDCRMWRPCGACVPCLGPGAPQTRSEA